MNLKKTFLLIVILIAFIACKQDNNQNAIVKNNTSDEKETPISPEYAICEGRVTGFSIGETMPGATMNYSMQTVVQRKKNNEEAITEKYYILYTKGEKHLILKYGRDKEGKQNDKIGEIIVFSEKYKTEKGIGVNSTLKEFLDAYPNATIQYLNSSDQYIAQAANSSIQFVLDKNGLTGKAKTSEKKVPVKVSDFKENTKIEQIRVYKN